MAAVRASTMQMSTNTKWQGENRVRKTNQSEKSRHGSTTCDRLSLSIFSLHKRDDSQTETLSHTLIVSIRVHSWLIGRRSHSAPSPFRIYRKMFVLQMLRDTLGLFHFDLFDCGVQRVVRFATFGCAAHVSGRMRERDARFWHADKFHRLLRRDCQLQRFRIG